MALILLSLGFWQLDRAEQKLQYHEVFSERRALHPVDITSDNTWINRLQELSWRRVSLAGKFDEDWQILLDNQVVNGKPGYFVFTPIAIKGESKRILVNRGWVLAGHDRNILPQMLKTNAEVALSGVVKLAPAIGITLKDTPPEELSTGVYRVNNIDMDQLSGLLNMELHDQVVRLEPDSEHGYYRSWAVPGSGREMHLGYAFQWFMLALVWSTVYIVYARKARKEVTSD